MKHSRKARILVTNDDGIYSKGIDALVQVAQEYGEVVVVAPNKAQSGMGHAITLQDPIRITAVNRWKHITAFACSGTPVDCVKVGIYEILDQRPDLVLSGINHGSNAATNVLYSGTMSAAVEGAMEGIPSIGISLDAYEEDADFEGSQFILHALLPKVLEHGMDKGTCWNVNVPNLSPEALKGIKVCRQASSFWQDRFEKRNDQFGRPYYWLTGEFNEHIPADDTDLHYLKEGFATLVPTQFDLTAHHTINTLKDLIQ